MYVSLTTGTNIVCIFIPIFNQNSNFLFSDRRYDQNYLINIPFMEIVNKMYVQLYHAYKLIMMSVTDVDEINTCALKTPPRLLRN